MNRRRFIAGAAALPLPPALVDDEACRPRRPRPSRTSSPMRRSRSKHYVSGWEHREHSRRPRAVRLAGPVRTGC